MEEKEDRTYQLLLDTVNSLEDIYMERTLAEFLRYDNVRFLLRKMETFIHVSKRLETNE